MDGRGDQWAGNHPGYPSGMLHPKAMQKGPPFVVPMMHQQNVFMKGGQNQGMMMHQPQGMVHMQQPMMPKFQDMGMHMPKMMQPPGPGYMHPGMGVPQRGRMQPMPMQEHMQNPLQKNGQPGMPGGSPVDMGKQRMVTRPMPGGPKNLMKVPSPSSMPPGFMGGGMHGGISPGSLGPSLSPRSMGGQVGPQGGSMQSNISPKSLMRRLSPESYRQHGNMMPKQNGGMMQPPKQAYAMKMPPKLVPGGMNFGPMMPPGPSQHLPMQGKRMGAPMNNQQMGKGMPPHLKPAPPLMMHKQLLPAHPQSQPTSMDNLQKQFRPAPKRLTTLPPPTGPQLGPALSQLPMPLPEVEPVNDVDRVMREQLRKSIPERMNSAISILMKDILGRAEGVYGISFKLSDETEVIDTIISEFLPIMDILWSETKKAHKYSLDETYMQLNGADSSKKKRFVLHRDMDELEDYYKRKEEIEKTLASYRTPAKPIQKDPLPPPPPEENEMSALMKAQEYADVGYNQRHLVQKITALDYRNALAGEECCNLLPESFRLQQIKMISTLHFDIRTPPRCVSPPSESINDLEASVSDVTKGANLTESSNFSSVASKLLEKQGSSFMEKMPDLPTLKLDMRYAKGPQVVPTPEMLMQLSGFNQQPQGGPMMFPKGMNFPMLPMPKMMPMRSKGPPPQIPPQNPRPKGEHDTGPPRPGPMIMRKQPGMYGGFY
ncbi:hypothetical protein BgAZ_100650 [Babesia gibsoni]|uniref:Uncharacterized protein n=1 Tax=Babesia gibsoni TaxID=33632 RepID=A0AAD8PF58_BABGI|nr:hypothetical protein BgAZ_100650 [Babesia gibsoni]